MILVSLILFLFPRLGNEAGIILGYKPQQGSNDAFHYGSVGGGDRKFIRVVAGCALPVLDRMYGAVVIVAEVYRPSGPASWVALEAASGAWPETENEMAKFRRDLKFTHVIVDSEAARPVIWHMKGINYGVHDIPLLSYAAPDFAGSEIGRSYVDGLIAETRLNIENVKRKMEIEPQMAALALQCAMCWMRDFQAIYLPPRKTRPGRGRYLGVEGL